MNQKIAIIDLNKKHVDSQPISTELRRLFLGGRGINASLLFRHTFEGMDSLAPEAPLIVGAGLLSGLPCPSASRCSITAKSPETGLLADSNIGGFFAAELRKTGFDHLVIQGASREPLYLLIKEGVISFESASHLWGKDSIETTELLKAKHGKTCQILCIGQAGENMVRFACVRHGLKSAAGRGGLGCLMGSKRLKAIVAKGQQKPFIAEEGELAAYTKTLNSRLRESKTSQVLHKYGTSFLFDLHNFKGIVRTFNGRLSQFKEGKSLRTSHLKKRYTSASACFGCVIACRHKYDIERRDGKTTRAEGPEYGTLAAFGPICGIKDEDALFKLNDLVNRFGLDSVTTGNIIAWAIELFQEGILTEKDAYGLSLQWGDVDIITKLVEQIVFREGLGNILADGPKQACKKFGPASENFLPWVKYLIQSDSVDVRAHKGFALAVATATRGADHLRSRPTLEALNLSEQDLKNVYGAEVSADATSYQGKARMVWWSECEFALADALGICRFVQRFNSPEHLSPDELRKLVLHATGMEFTAEEFFRIGERITTLERMFLTREGIGRRHDNLPARYFQPMPSGRYQGEVIDSAMFNRMLDEYYELHGWNLQTGIPEDGTVEKLELEFTLSGRLEG